MPDVATPSDLLAQARRCLGETPDLPRPGQGHTLQRWQALASLGARDLALAKVLEAHYDARAILADLGRPLPAPDQLLAVWAAEVPGCSLSADASGALSGSKAWCSGAGLVDAALVTVREGADPGLYLMPISAAVAPEPEEWPAPGMALIPSTTLRVARAAATRQSSEQAYLERPGFWHGGAGIAAVWLGAAGAIITTMQARAEGEVRTRLAGQAVMALAPAAALLRGLAARIDAAPGQTHRAEVVLARSVTERACTRVLDLAGRALGPGPMCLEPAHARRWADLTVFIRQSHADRDWAWLGAEGQALESTWRL